MAERESAVEGYLVLSDISGYTAFMSGAELEHAQGVIEDLTESILAVLTPVLRLVKLEGDAVFCHAPLSGFSSADYLLTLLEGCYCAFLDRLEEMQRNTTCTCAACANIGSLDLKFVAHRGTYVVPRVAGTADLAGPDVILVHRLLKNSIREATGLKAYAFLTEACDDMPSGVAGAIVHREVLESFGPVRGRVYDLKQAAERLRRERRVFLDAAEADAQLTYHLDAPAPAAWAAVSDGALAPKWSPSTRSRTVLPNADGRVGVDSERHCDHGSWESRSRILDWKPPHYYTLHTEPAKKSWKAPPPMLETWLVEPRDDGGSDVTLRMRWDDRRLPTRLIAKVLWPFVQRSMMREEATLNRFALENFGANGDAGLEPSAPEASIAPGSR